MLINTFTGTPTRLLLGTGTSWKGNFSIWDNKPSSETTKKLYDSFKVRVPREGYIEVLVGRKVKEVACWENFERDGKIISIRYWNDNELVAEKTATHNDLIKANWICVCILSKDEKDLLVIIFNIRNGIEHISNVTDIPTFIEDSLIKMATYGGLSGIEDYLLGTSFREKYSAGNNKKIFIFAEE